MGLWSPSKYLCAVLLSTQKLMFIFHKVVYNFAEEAIEDGALSIQDTIVGIWHLIPKGGHIIYLKLPKMLIFCFVQSYSVKS